jgi:hypothetical protein
MAVTNHQSHQPSAISHITGPARVTHDQECVGHESARPVEHAKNQHLTAEPAEPAEKTQGILGDLCVLCG